MRFFQAHLSDILSSNNHNCSLRKINCGDTIPMSGPEKCTCRKWDKTIQTRNSEECNFRRTKENMCNAASENK